MTEYDNTNRGAGWLAKAVSGTANVGGQEFYAQLVRTNAQPPAPTAFLYLRAKGQNEKSAWAVALFDPKPGKTQKFDGQLDMGDAGFWVHVFDNKSTNEKSPALDISFQPKEAQAAPTGEPAPFDPRGDDIPF